MATTTAALLRARNNKFVYLREVQREDGNIVAETCEKDDEGAVGFRIARVNGNQIGAQAMQALVGDDQYVQFSNWYAAQGVEEQRKAKAMNAKSGEGQPFDDKMEPSETYTAHMLALLKVRRRAVLREGMRDPSYREVADDLGLFEDVLYDAIWNFGREVVTRDPLP
ncbi:hypothetical protein [Deinococcus ruber]|uniref:Uncharacterized protein n=1 Tax=Deinococcus ruber TaxID=1848197 RepID=A0A918F8X1_9DEIO|nr:hypothetical protein [Deinococcus ruber]GGR16802.1 hypothetical protein GCM10008957_31800 [Deinococcus ruber]